MLCLCMLIVLCCCGGRKKVVRSQADLPGSRIGVQLGTVAQNDGLALLPQAFSKDDYAFCVSRDRQSLARQINHALRLLANDGTLDSIRGATCRAEWAWPISPKP